jgi:hypothetical protein
MSSPFTRIFLVSSPFNDDSLGENPFSEYEALVWLPCRLGRGSALALLGRLQEGVEEFSAAIAIDPSVADAWKV